MPWPTSPTIRERLFGLFTGMRPRHFLARRLARLIRKGNPERCWVQDSTRERILYRKRGLLAGMFARIVDRGTAKRRVPVQPLSRQGWLQWELTVGPLLGQAVAVSGQTLILKSIAAPALGNELTQQALTSRQRRTMLAQATQALGQLHERHLPLEDGSMWPLSHADATVWNVMAGAGEAAWMNFTARHNQEIPACWRQADDLRALLYSAAEFFPIAQLDELADAVLSAYGSTPAVEALIEWVESGELTTDIYHLAQVQADPTRHQRLSVLIIEQGTAIRREVRGSHQVAGQFD